MWSTRDVYLELKNPLVTQTLFCHPLFLITRPTCGRRECEYLSHCLLVWHITEIQRDMVMEINVQVLVFQINLSLLQICCLIGNIIHFLHLFNTTVYFLFQLRHQFKSTQITLSLSHFSALVSVATLLTGPYLFESQDKAETKRTLAI